MQDESQQQSEPTQDAPPAEEPTDPFDRAMAHMLALEEQGDAEPEPKPETKAEATEQPAVEPEPQQQGKEQEGPLSDRFAHLAQEEQRLRMQQEQARRELDEQRKALETERQSWQQQVAALNALQKGDYGALDQLGVDYDKWVAHKLGGGGTKAEQKQASDEVTAQIAELKRKIEEYDKREQERAQHQKRSEVMQQVEAAVGQDPEDSPGRWALLRRIPEWQDRVIKEAEREYAESSGLRDLTAEQAADRIEQRLREQFKQILSDQSAAKALGISAPQAETSQQQTPPRPASGDQQAQGTAKPAAETATLSADMGAEVASRTGETADRNTCFERALSVLAD